MQARVLGGAERMRAFVTRQAAQAREFAPEFILNFQLRAFVFFNVFSHWRRSIEDGLAGGSLLLLAR